MASLTNQSPKLRIPEAKGHLYLFVAVSVRGRVVAELIRTRDETFTAAHTFTPKVHEWIQGALQSGWLLRMESINVGIDNMKGAD